MTCADFERRLHELLDVRIQPESDFQLSHHAKHCAQCRQVLSGTANLLDGLELVDAPDLPDDFAQRTVLKVQLAEKSCPATTWRTNALLTGGVFAASLVIVLVSVFSGSDREVALNRTEQSRIQAQSREQTVQTAPHHETSVHVQKGATIASNEINEPNGPLLVDRISLPPLPKLTEFSRQIDSDTIPGVRPIRSSFSVAFGLLRGTLPGTRLIES